MSSTAMVWSSFTTMLSPDANVLRAEDLNAEYRDGVAYWTRIARLEQAEKKASQARSSEPVEAEPPPLRTQRMFA